MQVASVVLWLVKERTMFLCGYLSFLAWQMENVMSDDICAEHIPSEASWVFGQRLKMCLSFNRSRAASEATFATRKTLSMHQFLCPGMQEVHDEVISSGLGQAISICPLVLIACMPCNARVTATNVTNHSIGLTTDTGIEILTTSVLVPSR